MRFQVLLATSMKMVVFWVFAPCSLMDIDQRFRGVYCLHNQGALVMEAVSCSETLVNIHQITRRNIP
jgi:hypothetical protein